MLFFAVYSTFPPSKSKVAPLPKTWPDGDTMRMYIVFSPTGVELFCGIVKVAMSWTALVTFFSFLPFLFRAVSESPVTFSFSAKVILSDKTSLRRFVSSTRLLRFRFCSFIWAFSFRSSWFSLLSLSISST